MTDSIARRTLERARFFLERAESSEQRDRRALEYYLEAAIVFGRSVTFHLQKEFRHRTGFETWYAEKRSQMAGDPLFEFFKDKRNYVLKEGPIPVRKTVAVEITASIALSGFVEARVRRAKPWYRRSRKLWWEDIRAAIVRPLRRWCYQRQLSKKRRHSQEPVHAQVQERLHFEEPEWQDQAACDMLREYLLKLENVIREAELHFIEPQSNGNANQETT